MHWFRDLSHMHWIMQNWTRA